MDIIEEVRTMTMRIRPARVVLGLLEALVIVSFSLLACVLAGCARAPEIAEYPVPASEVTVVVERKPAHAALVEYTRSAYLVVARRSLAEVALFVDSGGYSRTNLFRLGERKLLLRDADGSYLIDLDARAITKDRTRRKEGTFLGSFDVDSSERWRFVPAAERPELATEFRGG